MKQARTEAGLSLAQLGRGHVTAPAIYLIETGRTRPSLPTLEHIARRTGKPVQFFLADPGGSADDGEASVLEFEAMIMDGQNEAAIALGLSLVERAPAAYRLGRVRYLLAKAFAASGRREQALAMLEEAKAQFEAVNDRAMLAACLGAEAAVILDSKPKDAAAIAERALSIVRTLTPAPMLTEASLRGIIADAYAASHEWDRAVAAYDDAIKFGSPALDMRSLARTYKTLAHAYHEVGEVDLASRYAMRSIALLELVRARATLSRWENRLGLAVMAKGDLPAARAHFEHALAVSAAEDLGDLLCDVLLNLCDVAFQESDLERALELAGKALAQAERTEEGASRAEAHVWLARIADRRGENETADREFERAIHDFEAAGVSDRLLHTHGLYADVLERRGELAKAYGHMKEALQASRPGSMRRHQNREQAGSA